MPAGARSVDVRLVIDGDTLELADNRRVRLIGVDTPEIGRRGKPSEPFAEAARDRLQMLSGAQVRLIEGSEAKDRYGRTLAHLFDASGNNIEATLLREGLGFALAVPPNDAMIGCHLNAEQEARRAGRGLWGGRPITPASSVQQGGFQLISAEIRKVSAAGRYLWLDTDGPVVLRIDREQFANFGLGAPDALLGRSVVVRGWVIDRRSQGRLKAGFKPFMLPVRHPAMLELD